MEVEDDGKIPFLDVGGCLDQFCRLLVYLTDIYFVARDPHIPAIWCAIQRVPILLG